MSWRRESRRQRRRWLRSAARLGACALVSVQVHAQDGVSVLEVVVDRRAPAVAPFLIRDNAPHATLAQWRHLGVRLPAAFDAAQTSDALVSALALPGVSASLDAQTQTLRLTQAPDLSGLTVLGNGAREGASDLPRDVGAVLNYDVVIQRSASQTVRGALLDARVFGPLGVFEHGVIVSDSTASRVLRLNTTFTQVYPDRLLRARAGDFVSGGLSWTRPVRLAGLQLMKDFALRPDLVTTPTPTLGGTVAVPSTVEVLVNGVRQLSQAVEPGRFEIRQLPTVSGAGDIALIVRDPFGRETVQSLPFYAVDRQLAPGLTTFSVEAGRVRRKFGVESNDHGPLAASASLRAGLSPRLTVETHLEATRGTALLGAAGVLEVAHAGLLSAHLATSRGGGQRGAQWGVGAERRAQRFHVAAAMSRGDPGFRDIAATQADAPPLRSQRLSGGIDFGRYGTLGAAWVHQRTATAQAASSTRSVRLASLSYSVALGPSVQAFASAFRSLGSDRAHGVSVHLSIPFGARSSGSVSYLHHRGGASAVLQASQSASDVGEFGWRLQSDQRVAGNTLTRQQGDLEYRAPVARLHVAAESSGGQGALRLGVQGALVYLAGAVHAAPRVGESLALVEVADMPGVGVLRENRWVGRTDSRGQLVVPDLLPYQSNRIAIDPLDLPLDTEFSVPNQDVRPVERSAVVVRFGVERQRSALVVLEDANGRPLPLGAIATPTNGADAQVIGHEGQVFLRHVDADNELSVGWGGASRCTARFSYADRDRSSGRIGPVPCL